MNSNAERQSDLCVLMLVAPGPLGESLRALVSVAARARCVAAVSDYDEALEVLSAHHPGLVVVAMAAVECEAQRFLEYLASEWPGLPCLVLAESVEQGERAQGLYPGRVLLQGVPAEKLTQAVARLTRPTIATST